MRRIKKTYCVNIVFLTVMFAFDILSARTAHGDVHTPQLSDVGVVLSLSRSNFGGASIESSVRERTPVNRFTAGIFCVFEYGKISRANLGLTSGLAYVTRGSDTEMDGQYLGGARTSYLDLPLLVRGGVNVSNSIEFFSVLGMTPSILLLSKRVNRDGSELDEKKSTANFDVAITAGIGFRFSVNRNINVSIEVRHLRGLMTITEANESEILNRANLFSFGVSYDLEQ